jgi:murein tripeptide amidase MpaA
MQIDSDFEGGCIEVVGKLGRTKIRLRIPADPEDARFRQWFAFALRGPSREERRVEIVNAGDCTWARGWGRYRVCASRNGAAWTRVPTSYDGGTLSFTHAATAKSGTQRTVYAYFPLYPASRIDNLVRRAVAAGACHRIVAKTPRGKPVPLLGFGQTSAPAPSFWIIAQQHPGEPMAGWFMEGLIERLLAGDDETRALLKRISLWLLPRMNPDGCALANHRTNAAGLDLNRQWAEPDPRAPEVAGVRAAMKERGVDFFLDVHGDETIPYVFVQGTQGLSRQSDRVIALEACFCEAMLKASAEFQTEHGYPRDLPGEANLKIAANWAADTFDCLALTIEMPFGDNANKPDDAAGWSIERSARLGADTLSALLACVNGR